MANAPSITNETVTNTHNTLKKAVKAALERKRKLGQYSVIWRENNIITQGEDAPPPNQTQIK